jgi:antitoxin component HigA of HigAB toxin-antitoxin module
MFLLCVVFCLVKVKQRIMNKGPFLRTKQDYEAALARIHALMQLAIEPESALAGELDALVGQVEQYEKQHFRMSEILEAFLALGSPEEQARVDTRMMLAAKIDDSLKAKGLSQKQFAEMMGKKPSVIRQWLSGGCNFRVDTLTDIQRVLEIRLLDLDNPKIGRNGAF